MYLQYSNIEYHVFDLCCKKIKCSERILKVQLPYRIKIRPKKFHRTKFSVGQSFRLQAEILSILSDFSLAIVLAFWTKCSVGQNFRHQAEISSILSDFCLTIVLAYWTKFFVG